MGAVGLVARLQLRRRARSLLVVAVVAGLAGGAALALIAGSRRSATVVGRYFAKGISYDFSFGGTTASRSQLQALPMVQRADREAYVAFMHLDRRGRPDGGINGMAIDREAIDPTMRLIAGTFPTAGDPTGVFANESFVRQFGLHLGDTIETQTFSASQDQQVQRGIYDHPAGPPFEFHLIGVVQTPSDIALDEPKTVAASSYGATNQMFLPYEWYDANAPRFLNFGPGGFEIQLRRPGDRAAFTAALARVAPDSPGEMQPPRFSERRASFTTPVGFETGVLLALGIAIAFAGAIVVGLLLRGEQRSQSVDDPILRGLGLTRTELGVTAALRTVPIAFLAAAMAIGFAYLLSGRFPVGVGHQLELDRGLRANLPVLGIGGIVIVTFLTGVAFALGRGRTRARAIAISRSTLAGWLNRRGAPADAVVGTELAFERGGNGRVPTRPAIAGGVVTLAIVAAVVVFAASVDHLYASPPAHGWPWDIVIGNPNFDLSSTDAARIAHDPRLSAVTAARYGQATIGGDSTELLMIDPDGTSGPTVLSGRLPRTGSEIALGPKLLEHLHSRVGSTVRLSLANSEFIDERGTQPTKDLDLTIVGTGLTPIFGESELADEATVTTDAIKAAGGLTTPRLMLARIRPGTGAAIKGLRADYTAEMATDVIPARVVNLHRVRSLPLVGAFIAALMGIVLLAYTLAIGVRARTRELGVLRALGMSTGRVGRVLAWQGVIIAALVTIIGLPAGVFLGIAAWRAMAHSLGVADRATMSLALAFLVPITVAIGLAASVLPARRARHENVAALLRVE